MRATAVNIVSEERALQDLVDEVLAQSLWITHACRLPWQKLVGERWGIHLAVMAAALLRRECEHALGAIKLRSCLRSGNECYCFIRFWSNASL